MARTPDPQRRAELLAAIADHLLANGLSGTSLRPLAKALKTSPRTLLYHFGSKEELISEGLAESRRRQAQMLTAWMAEHGRDQRGRLEHMWAWLTDPQTEPFLRLFFEIYALALQQPEQFPGFLEHAVGDWLPILQQGAEEIGHPASRSLAVATLVIGSYRGLLLDLLATGDRKRVQTAHQQLLEGLDHTRAANRRKAAS